MIRKIFQINNKRNQNCVLFTNPNISKAGKEKSRNVLRNCELLSAAVENEADFGYYSLRKHFKKHLFQVKSAKLSKSASCLHLISKVLPQEFVRFIFLAFHYRIGCRRGKCPGECRNWIEPFNFVDSRRRVFSRGLFKPRS